MRGSYFSVWSSGVSSDFNSRLYMRGSLNRSASFSLFGYFNSRLYMRGSCEELEKAKMHWNFNSRLYMRGSRNGADITAKKLAFQFTPLHERQHNKIARKVEYQYFNSRLYMRGSHWCRQVSCCRLYFNSRLYMRGSGNVAPNPRGDYRFQFTPLHERQPEVILFGTSTTIISIHASTWEAALSWEPIRTGRLHFNSRLYMRGSWCWRSQWRTAHYFNSRLYMRGSRRKPSGERSGNISIHASTWEAAVVFGSNV